MMKMLGGVRGLVSENRGCRDTKTSAFTKERIFGVVLGMLSTEGPTESSRSRI